MIVIEIIGIIVIIHTILFQPIRRLHNKGAREWLPLGNESPMAWMVRTGTFMVVEITENKHDDDRHGYSPFRDHCAEINTGRLLEPKGLPLGEYQ